MPELCKKNQPDLKMSEQETLTCTFNIDGVCTVAQEFPRLTDKPCRFNEDGICTAKPTDLIKICPDCGETHDFGKCDALVHYAIVPNKTNLK